MHQILISSLSRVAWVDPAGDPTQAKYGTSRSAIIVIGQDNLERIHILKCFIERCPTTKLEQEIMLTQNQWKPQRFGIDVSANQGMFFSTMQRRAREEGCPIHWAPKPLTGNKLIMIEQTLEPIIRAGRMSRMPERECRMLKDEFNRFPDLKYNDGMDALANAIHLLPSSLPEFQKQMDASRLQAYLRRIGTAEEDIVERLRLHSLARN